MKINTFGFRFKKQIIEQKRKIYFDVIWDIYSKSEQKKERLKNRSF